MNKKILSLAVAAAMVAPGAAMAEAILYGKLNMSIDWADVTNVISQGSVVPEIIDPETGQQLVAPIPDRDQNFQGWGLNGGGYIPGEKRANRIGVKGSEDLGNGLKAIYQVEFGIQMTEESRQLAATGSNNSPTMRNSFLGLAGDWGTFLVGRHDTPVKISTGKLDLFSDTMADYNGTVGFNDVRADNVVAYISPSLSGFQLMAAVHAGGGSTITPSNGNIFADSIAEGWSAAGIYSNGPFYVSAAYEMFGNDLYMDSTTVLLGDPLFIDPDTGEAVANPNFVADDFSVWRIGLGLLDWNGFTLTAIYEDQADRPAGQLWNQGSGAPAPDGLKLWQVQAGYAFGNNMVKAMYGSGTRDSDFDTSLPEIEKYKNTLDGDYYTWAIGFDHNFSKRTKAYVLYTQVDDDASQEIRGSQWDGFSLGMMHSF
ncbi:porin [Thiocapsa roseopersicina]|uniref:Outer membrane protein (Porin) n=1 Tax=Thiocapsa roseopersicina TaxID=1058 RepID=A0A1H2XE43_THIRO|nr:porin [Thiocapsa roseopersicina]SDW91026.1 Outer membrane protein (porin) [Thiocapsa roseopersicina]